MRLGTAPGVDRRTLAVVLRAIDIRAQRYPVKAIRTIESDVRRYNVLSSIRATLTARATVPKDGRVNYPTTCSGQSLMPLVVVLQSHLNAPEAHAASILVALKILRRELVDRSPGLTHTSRPLVSSVRGRGNTVHRRLWGLVVVLVVSAVMAVPAFAQDEEAETADQGSVFTTDFCPTLEQDAAVWDLMLSMFPSLGETCGAEAQIEPPV